jgi:hypothetical protein
MAVLRGTGAASGRSTSRTARPIAGGIRVRNDRAPSTCEVSPDAGGGVRHARRALRYDARKANFGSRHTAAWRSRRKTGTDVFADALVEVFSGADCLRAVAAIDAEEKTVSF